MYQLRNFVMNVGRIERGYRGYRSTPEMGISYQIDIDTSLTPTEDDRNMDAEEDEVD